MPELSRFYNIIIKMIYTITANIISRTFTSILLNMRLR